MLELKQSASLPRSKKVAAEGDGRKFKGLAWLFMGVPRAAWAAMPASLEKGRRSGVPLSHSSVCEIGWRFRA